MEIRRVIDGDITPSRVSIEIGRDEFIVDSGNSRGISQTNIGLATRNGRPISRDLALQIVDASSVFNDYKYSTAEADRVTENVLGQPSTRSTSARRP